MSGGSPVAGGYMRQRHSQGYASSGDDLEDDACSRCVPQTPPYSKDPVHVGHLETFIWISSAIFMIYYGDRHSNFFHVLWHDERIRRTPLYIVTFGIGLNICFFLYMILSTLRIWKTDEKWEMCSIYVFPLVAMLGVISFCLLCFAVWPIWGFLSLPLAFTLFMTCMVILPHTVFGALKPRTDVLRID